MKKIKIKYLIGTLLFAILAILSLIKINTSEQYGLILFVFIFALLGLLVFSTLLYSNVYTHIVTDKKGKTIRKFENEKKAVDFADNQDYETKVIMIMIKK